MTGGLDLHELVATAAEAVAPLSATAVRMSAAASEPDLGAADIGALAMEDPAITAILLREANSVDQSARSEIGTPEGAVSRLGVTRAISIAVYTSAGAVMATTLHGYGIASHEYVRHSTSSAIVAELVRELAAPAIDPTVATSALLHDIGKVLLDPHLVPEHFAAAIQQGASSVEAENELLDLNHAEVGSSLCETWGLPALIGDTVADHHFTDPSTAGVNTLAVAVAQWLARDLDLTIDRPDHWSHEDLYVASCDRLGLPNDVLVQCEAHLAARGVTGIGTGVLPR